MQPQTPYERFIRDFLVTRCYMEYCKLCKIMDAYATQNKIVDVAFTTDGIKIISEMPDIIVDSNENIHITPQTRIAHVHNEVVWNTVFCKLAPILEYYIDLLGNLGEKGECSIAFEHSIQIYNDETFQEHIDSTLNMTTLGAYDYNRFIINMKNDGFRQNMFAKFENKMALRRLKNHLVYITRLYLQKELYDIPFMTKTESLYLDNILDATSYFNYLATRESTDCEKENRVLEIIDRMLFV